MVERNREKRKEWVFFFFSSRVSSLFGGKIRKTFWGLYKFDNVSRT